MTRPVADAGLALSALAHCRQSLDALHRRREEAARALETALKARADIDSQVEVGLSVPAPVVTAADIAILCAEAEILLILDALPALTVEIDVAERLANHTVEVGEALVAAGGGTHGVRH